jgi:hypothetical protein
MPQAKASILGLDKLAAIKREEDRIKKENGGDEKKPRSAGTPQWEGVCFFLFSPSSFSSLPSPIGRFLALYQFFFPPFLLYLSCSS